MATNAAGTELAKKKCVACVTGTAPLKGRELQDYLARLEGWTAVDEHHIAKTYKFKDFAEALEFVNRIGKLADDEDHHPDIRLSWGKVTVELWTHKAGGLTENDFIFAAKTDELPRARA